MNNKYAILIIMVLFCALKLDAQINTTSNLDLEVEQKRQLLRLQLYIDYLRGREDVADIFISNAKAIIYHEQDCTVDTISVNKFLKLVETNRDISYKVDSVQMNDLNSDVLAEKHKDTIPLIFLPFILQEESVNRMLSDSVKHYKPLLGDIKVSSYKYKPTSIPTSNISNRPTINLTGAFLDKHKYNARVAFVSEFIDRFNTKELNQNIDTTMLNYKVVNTLMLFDKSKFSSEADEDFIAAKEFAETVISDSLKVDYYDKDWIAIATCHGKLMNKDIDFTMYLTVENRRDDLFKWSVNRIEGAYFKLTPSKINDGLMIYPDDHETKFMSLRNMTVNQPDCIMNFMQKDYKVDETSVFLTYVYNGLLKIEYVESLQFMFLQIPNYGFTIDYFERDDYNSGWLINSLFKISDAEKEKFLNYIYQNNYESQY